MPCKALTFSHDFLYNVSEKQKSKSEKLESKQRQGNRQKGADGDSRTCQKGIESRGLVETWCK